MTSDTRAVGMEPRKRRNALKKNPMEGVMPDDLKAPADTPMVLVPREELRRLNWIIPYLDWTIGDESPGHHPTMPSAVGAFKHRLAALLSVISMETRGPIEDARRRREAEDAYYGARWPAPTPATPAEQVADERAAYEQYAKDCGFEFPPEGLSLKEWGWQLWRNAREIAPSPGEGDAPVAWRVLAVEDGRPIGQWSYHADIEWARAHPTLYRIEPLYTRPTPATPEGLREALQLLYDCAQDVRKALNEEPAMQGPKYRSLGITFTTALDVVRNELRRTAAQAGEGE